MIIWIYNMNTQYTPNIAIPYPKDQTMIENIDAIPVDEVLKGLVVRRGHSRLQISYQWRRGLGGFRSFAGEIVVFLFGTAILAISVMNVVVRPGLIASTPPWQWIIYLAFVLLGIILVYHSLGLALNRSVFEIDDQEFKTRSGPLPLLGAKPLSLPFREIASVEWRKVGHTTRGSADRPHSGYSATFDVIVITTQGQKHPILTGLNDPQYAYAITGEISKFLK